MRGRTLVMTGRDACAAAQGRNLLKAIAARAWLLGIAFLCQLLCRRGGLKMKHIIRTILARFARHILLVVFY